jgi:hypothetical protein
LTLYSIIIDGHPISDFIPQVITIYDYPVIILY